MIDRPDNLQTNSRNGMRCSSDWNWSVHSTYDRLAKQAADYIIATAANAIAGKGEFHFVATGGETVRRIYNLVASSPSMDWQAWHVYLTDERCAPDGSELRNSTMLSREFLNRVRIPESQVHLIPGELGPTAAAQAYGCEVEGVAAFDLVLLGLGEDGHIASLFPGNQARDELVVPVFDSPKPPTERVSLAPAMLQRAHQILLVVSGSAKRRALMGIGAADSLFQSAIGGGTSVTVLADKYAAPDCFVVSTE
jgi:6-phosphogluconolactonase